MFILLPQWGSLTHSSRCDCIIIRSNTSKLVLVFKVVVLTGDLFIPMKQPFQRIFLGLLFCSCSRSTLNHIEKQISLLWSKLLSNKKYYYWIQSLVYILGLDWTWCWITNSFLKIKSPLKEFGFGTSHTIQKQKVQILSKNRAL